MLLNPFTYNDPKTAKEAAALLGSLKDAKILAGGTFLVKNLKALKKKGLKTPSHIISLKHVDELKGISSQWDTVVIKAMTTVTEISESDALTGSLIVLKNIAKEIGTTTIRNMATLGGNLTCRYTWTEFASALMALDATMHFITPEGNPDIISAVDFFKAEAKTNNLFTHVTLKKTKDSRCIYKRVVKRSPVDVPLFSFCLHAGFKNNRFNHVHVAVNNGVQFAQKDLKLEDFLNGHTAKESTPEKALHHLTENIYDIKSDEYKKQAFRVHMKNAIKELVGNFK